MYSLNLRSLLPSLFLALCVLVVCWLAVHVDGTGWTVLAAPLLLALTILAADLWQARLLGQPLRPSPGVLMLAVSVVVAGLIIGVGDPKQVQAMMPVLSAVSAVAISTRRRNASCAIRHIRAR